MSKGSSLYATAVGRLGRDPNARDLADGKSVCDFSIACTSGWGQRETTTWVKVKSFNKNLNDRIVDFIGKGSRVLVHGEVTQESWTTQQGETRVDLVITVGFTGYVEFLDSKADDEARRAANGGGASRGGGQQQRGANREDRENPADRETGSGGGRRGGTTGGGFGGFGSYDDLDDDVPF